MHIEKMRQYRSLNLAGETRRITDLRMGVKNPDRVNVYVNDKFAFSLDISQVVDLRVKKGLVISEEQLLEFKKASEFGKLYQRTLEWVLMRPHSERECRDYLRRKLTSKSKTALRDKGSNPTSLEWFDEFSDRIVQRLKDKKYLDDYKFAEWYAEYLTDKKHYPVKRVKAKLREKGVAAEVISEVLAGAETNDSEMLEKIIAKKRAKYPDDQKLIAYLVRQGFDYALVRELVEESSSVSIDE